MNELPLVDMIAATVVFAAMVRGIWIGLVREGLSLAEIRPILQRVVGGPVGLVERRRDVEGHGLGDRDRLGGIDDHLLSPAAERERGDDVVADGDAFDPFADLLHHAGDLAPG